MKALIYEGPQRVSLREVPIPKIGPGEALVQVEACGLCGTDLVKIYNGNSKPPVPLGHEVAGQIEKLGSSVKQFKVGDRVVVAHHVPCFECHYCVRGHPSMCREFKRSNLDPGGFAQFVRVSEQHLKHTTFKIPAKIDFATASQVEPLACCLRNARRLGLAKGDTAVIVGLGSIGLMTAQVLVRLGVTAIGVDIDAQRVSTAHKSGIEHAYTGKEGRTEELIQSMTEYRGADALVFTAGSPQLVSERLSWLRDGGTLNIFASFYPDSKAWFDLNEIYHREIRIMSSYSPAIEDLQEALGLIVRKEIDMHPHSHHAFPMDQFNEVVRQVRGREILKAILLPQKVAVPAAI